MCNPGAPNKRSSSGFILVDAIVSLAIVVVLAVGLSSTVGGFVTALSRASEEVERSIAEENATDELLINATTD